MNRRGLLRRTTILGIVGMAGCQSDKGTSSTSTTARTTTQTTRETTTAEPTTEQPTSTSAEETTETDVSTYHVAPDGVDSGNGTAEEPLATIYEALQRATAGDTIDVAPGTYWEEHAPGEPLQTIRDGETDAPITITGPEDAILRPSLRIKHSHIRLRGLTIEALLDPEEPDDPSWYFDYPIGIRPPADSDEYLEDIVCAPAAVGYSAFSLIRVVRTKDLEIGPLKVTGLAGASWILPDKQNEHAGEIIYLGSPPGQVFDQYGPEADYPWEGEIDETRNVHIHHVDNSEAHPHSELVDAKVGTRDILVEYCTDAGGSQNTEFYPSTSIGLRSYDATVRWCDLRGGSGDGVRISSGPRYILQQIDNPQISLERIGKENAIYGNRIMNFGNASLMFKSGHPDSNQRQFELITPADQDTICGNDLEGVYSERIDHTEVEELDFDSPQECGSDVPNGEGQGHTGGDSPWE